MITIYGYREHGGPEQEAFLSVADPVPGPGELLVEVRAAGVNPADWKRRAGGPGAVATLDHPVGLGREVAGVVVAMGDGVTGFAPGDAVLGQVADGPYGGFAHLALTAASWTSKKPDALSFVAAAALPIAAATAYDALVQFDLPPGATLVVLGAGGGVGLAACQFGRERGLEVVGIASAAKRDLVERAGAQHVDAAGDVLSVVRSLVPSGVDGLLDLVGADPLRAVAPVLAPTGTLLTAADVTTAESLGGGRVARARSSAVLDAIVELANAGRFYPFVTTVLPLAEAGAALRLVESGHAIGKVVLDVA